VCRIFGGAIDGAVCEAWDHTEKEGYCDRQASLHRSDPFSVSAGVLGERVATLLVGWTKACESKGMLNCQPR